MIVGWENLSNCNSGICCLCCPTTSIVELIVDGILANVGIGIVSLLCLSSLVKKVPVPIACGTDPVSLLVLRKSEFLEDDIGMNQV